jgi:PAS domain S-box-containing protein
MSTGIHQKLPDNVLDHLNIVITDLDQNITFISCHYAKTMGYTCDELLGKHPNVLRHPDVGVFSIFDAVDEYNDWNGIFKNITKSGETVYFNAEVHKNYDDDGNHDGYYSINTDITDTVTDPHKFIFDNELFGHLFIQTDDLVAVCLCESPTNEKQRILDLSDKLAQFIGLEKEDIFGRQLSFVEILSPNCKYYNDLDLLIEDFTEDKHTPIKIRNGNGKDHICKLIVIPFEYHGGLIRIFRLVDITTETEYAAQLNKVIKSKNNFLANISHDIKTPLSAISGFLTLLKLNEKAKEKRDYITIIQDSTRHLLDLTNDFIDFARMDNKKLEVVYHEFTPKDIQSTIEIFIARGMEKNINFNAYMSPQLPEIMSQDIVRIKQIITNLISNALKFVKKGGMINFDCSYYHGNLQIIVEDDGIGMSDKQIARVFKPYTQATDKTSLTYGGSGLGLTVVQQLINLMGGTISIESELGKGAKFTVSIPTKIIKQNAIGGKIDIEKISIFDSTFTSNDIDLLKRYLIHFTSGKIDVVKELNRESQDELIIVKAADITLDPNIQDFSVNNKLIIVKRLNDVLHDITDDNILELNLPILGSKLYNALSSLVLKKETTYKDIPNPLDFEIKCKILVADDLHSNRLLIKELFANYDIELTLASNGCDALKCFKKSVKNSNSAFDFILLDMNMPDINGTETARKIRNVEDKLGLNRIPIAALTANRYEKNDVQLIDMDECLSKPINFKQLLLTIVKYTNNQNIVIRDDGSKKLKKLKEIKNDLIQNGKALCAKDYKRIFNPKEYKLLAKMIDESKNKKKLKDTYNKLMKIIRKST